MSELHPTLAKKRSRKLRKLLRQTPYTSIDLVDWLQGRGHCNTAGSARQLLEDGRVEHDGHVVGRVKIPILADDKKDIKWLWGASPLVPSSYRDKLNVKSS